MFTVVGCVTVLGAVIGGFVLEGGPIGILNQTIEFLIIGGAATGSLLAGTLTKVLGTLGGNLKMAIGGSGYSKSDYMELFNMLYEVFSVVGKSGEMALEKNVDDPANSEIFKKISQVSGQSRSEKPHVRFPCAWWLAARPAPTNFLT